MRIYYLTQHGHKIVRPLDVQNLPRPIYCHAVKVEGTDWYGARAKAFQHAAEAGERHCLIVVGHCSPVRVGRGNSHVIGGTLRLPKTTEPRAPSPESDHGLLLYVERMLERHVGAVHVPPVGAVAQLPAGWAMHVPTIPMVVGYSVAAVMSVEHDDACLGYNLSSAGFRVVTLGDYGYNQFGPSVMDEYGTTKKWKKAYEEATREYL